FGEVSAGGFHGCAIKTTDSTVACWGLNFDGEATPLPGGFQQVSAGPRGGGNHSHSCGVRVGGALACWGVNDDLESAPLPLGAFTQVSAGPDYTCAVRVDGALLCWGLNTGVATPVAPVGGAAAAPAPTVPVSVSPARRPRALPPAFGRGGVFAL